MTTLKRVKFTILPKEVLIRRYFILKMMFMQFEDRFYTRDSEGAFDHVIVSFAIACVHLAPRIGRRIRYPWRLIKVARKVFQDTVAP